MFFGLTSPWTSARFVDRGRLDQLLERGREVGVAARAGEQVGLEADREEDRVAVELRGQRRAAPPNGVDGAEGRADRARVAPGRRRRRAAAFSRGDARPARATS
jgi:hypothetical protein